MEENKNNFPEEKDINITEETTVENTVDEQTETTLETARNDTEATDCPALPVYGWQYSNHGYNCW